MSFGTYCNSKCSVYKFQTMTTIFQENSIASTGAIKVDTYVDLESISPAPSPSSFTPYHLNIINTFPWMAEFFMLCHQDNITVNATSLEKLMSFYYTNVIGSLKECYSEQIRASKFKKSMSEVLIFFHMSYSELKLPVESTFLSKMSDLMALYLNLEIEASRSGTESLENIASKITSCLFIYFGSSHSHIIDTILKTKNINRDSWELSDQIFRRVLRDSPGFSVNVITYTRYLLAFKMWKGIMSSAEQRKRIQLMAEQHLIPPSDFKEQICWSYVLRDIFPSIPESETNITQFLMEAKYTVYNKIEMFMNAVADPKLLCALECPNPASTNFSNTPDKKEDDWTNMDLESEIEDSLLSKEINNCLDNKPLCKLKNENELENKWKNTEMLLGYISEEENSHNAVVIEDIIKKDNTYHADSFWEGDTMDVAAEIELPSSPLDVTGVPNIKIEHEPSHSKENVFPLGASNTYSYQDYTEFDSKPEFIIEKSSVEADFLNSQNKPQFCFNKGQTSEISSSAGDLSTTLGFGAVHSLCKVLSNSNSIDFQRAQSNFNDKYLPLTPINMPFENPNGGILSEEQNEISSEENNEELSSEEFNEEFHTEEFNVRSLNHKSSRELNEEKELEECIKGRTVEFSNVQRPSETISETPPEKRGLIHDFTLKNDNKIYKFHLKLSSYWKKLSRHTWISLLFPLFSEQDIKAPRCTCFRCSQNYNIIMKNWKSAVTNLSRLSRDLPNIETFSGNFDNSILNEMKESLETDGLKLLVWEPEMDGLYTKIEELIKEEIKLSKLPIKKRKSFLLNSYVKDERKEISYPNTPMISIAEVEMAKEKYRLNAMNMNYPSTCISLPPPLNYMPDYLSHPDYPNTADIEREDAMFQSNITNIPSDQNSVLGAISTTFIPEHQEQNRPKFKTPAQLKEFQHLSAAEDLINFSLSSRAYYNKNQEPREENEREKRKSRQKTKAPKKRKLLI